MMMTIQVQRAGGGFDLFWLYLHGIFMWGHVVTCTIPDVCNQHRLQASDPHTKTRNSSGAFRRAKTFYAKQPLFACEKLNKIYPACFGFRIAGWGVIQLLKGFSQDQRTSQRLGVVKFENWRRDDGSAPDFSRTGRACLAFTQLQGK